MSRSHFGVVGGASRILRLKPPLSPCCSERVVTMSRKPSTVTFDKAWRKCSESLLEIALFVLTGSKYLVEEPEYLWDSGAVACQSPRLKLW
jgi:hypothetical protein